MDISENKANQGVSIIMEIIFLNNSPFREEVSFVLFSLQQYFHSLYDATKQ